MSNLLTPRFSATPVPFGRGRGKPVNVPDHLPPPGYLCYRCREKGLFINLRIPFHPRSQANLFFSILGHWIQACPTNDDPKFDGKYRVKRSTGIPRSLQLLVDKPESLAPDGSTDDSRNTGVMVNADGDFVIAKPDKAAWELYQEKVKASAAAAAEAAAAEESKALQARGLECPIDKRMFLEPTKTPCCQRTYCNDCISNALIESDFVCPGCSTEGVLLDNLIPDEEAVSKIKTYEAEKAEAKKEKEKQAAASQDEVPVNEAETKESATASKEKQSTPKTETDDASASTQSKKRPAENDLTPESANANGNSDTAAKKPRSENPTDQSSASADGNAQDNPAGAAISPFNGQQLPFAAPGMMPPFTDPGFGNNAMGFMNPMPMANGFPTMGPGGWNMPNMPNMPFNQPGMFGDQSNGFPNMFNGDPSMGMGFPPMGQMPPMPNGGFPGPNMGNFSNQQRTTFGGPYSHQEDSAYFRQPVNPQRHQARNRRVRPSDYREL